MRRVGKSLLRGAVAHPNGCGSCRATLIRSLAALLRINSFPVIEKFLPVHAMNRKVTFTPLSRSKHARICGLGQRFRWKSPCYGRVNAKNPCSGDCPCIFPRVARSPTGDRFTPDCVLSHAPEWNRCSRLSIKRARDVKGLGDWDRLRCLCSGPLLPGSDWPFSTPKPAFSARSNCSPLETSSNGLSARPHRATPR